MYTYVIYVKPTILCDVESVVSDMVREPVQLCRDVPAFILTSPVALTDEQKASLLIGNETLKVTRIELTE